MAITATTLPDVLLSINPGKFGKLEGRTSHYGVLNAFYNNTMGLVDEAMMAKLRDLPYTRTASIPIMDKYVHTIVTVRSCDIAGPSVSTRKKNITRFHVAISMEVNPFDYETNLLTVEKSLAWQYKMAMKAVYLYLDTACAAYLDTNKDTTITVGSDHPLYTGVTGAYQLPANKPEEFYLNLATIMEELDIQGPFVDVASTIALADRNRMRYNGGGSTLDTRAILADVGISQFEWSNRISRGTNRSVHYVFPEDSVGILNFIDPVYKDKPVIATTEYMEQWNAAKNMSDITLWAQTSDQVFNRFDWGVLQKLTCVDETIKYSTKMSADFALLSDYTSTSGESPIKRFEMVQP